METDKQPLSERYWTAGLLVAVGVAMIVSLAALGRVWWCERGDLRPWSWDVWSPHNSQHLIDPYSLSHMQHGIGLYVLLAWLFGAAITPRIRSLIVGVVEAAWEITENTEWLIERYRETTISLDYYGDSILNSTGDYVACLLGIVFARTVPTWVSVAVFCCLELISLLWIRDSLMLNIIMLVRPLDAVKQWQLGQ